MSVATSDLTDDDHAEARLDLVVPPGVTVALDDAGLGDGPYARSTEITPGVHFLVVTTGPCGPSNPRRLIVSRRSRNAVRIAVDTNAPR